MRRSPRRRRTQSSPARAKSDSHATAGAYATLLAIVALTIFVYAPSARYQFLNWDDPQYVTQNVHVQQGLTWPNVRWAFTTSYASNWHPLTWLSHMADVEWWGVAPGPAHVTNVALHVMATAVLFVALWQMTGAWAPSGFVTALFAVHPLHVESVAWIAERKDVLSTLFWVLTLWAYVAYVRRPARTRALLVASMFLLALLAKPMVVTLPFVLLLLDIWPLGRLPLHPGAGARDERLTVAIRLVREKLPLFALAAASSVMTFLAQRQGGAVAQLEGLPLRVRLTNAVVSYVVYLQKMIWPTGLANFYPFSQTIPAGVVAVCGLALVAMSVAAVRNLRQRPYLLVGWLWYVGTLVPVIGVIQVGSQARADRYTYVPLIGAFIACVWLARDVSIRWPRWRPWLIAGGVLMVGVLALDARTQAGYWQDSVTLWQHALAVTAPNETAEGALGEALAEQGRSDEAIVHDTAAIRLNPAYPFAYNNLGAELRRRHQTDEAIRNFSEALRLRPNFYQAANNLGNALVDAGRIDEGIARYAEALRLNPDYAEAHYGLGVALARAGKWAEAVAQFSESARLQPGSADALTALAAALASAGQFQAAAQQASLALRLNPQQPVARSLLNQLLKDGALSPGAGGGR